MRFTENCRNHRNAEKAAALYVSVRNGKGTVHKKHKRTQEAQKSAYSHLFCASCVPYLCFLCTVPFPLGKAICDPVCALGQFTGSVEHEH
jgi:hypothetical protein